MMDLVYLFPNQNFLHPLPALQCHRHAPTFCQNTCQPPLCPTTSSSKVASARPKTVLMKLAVATKPPLRSSEVHCEGAYWDALCSHLDFGGSSAPAATPMVILILP